MTWRGHTWEFVLSALSWLVAIGAILFVAVYLAFDAHKQRRQKARR